MRTVGKATYKKPAHGLGFFQVKGRLMLYRGSEVLEIGVFDNRIERRFLMKIWNRKHQVYISPHLFHYVLRLS